jgi:hypothetical protein
LRGRHGTKTPSSGFYRYLLAQPANLPRCQDIAVCFPSEILVCYGCGVPARWVTGDEVYGAATALRAALE